jgi:4-hydroxy-tetrahydrodipicolinate synthase
MIVPHARCPFQGSFVAIPTPFRHGEIDWGALRTIIEFHAAHRTDGIVVCGTTGESATLQDSERRALIETTLGLVKERMPVIAGVGTNCTRTTVDHAIFASKAGVDGLLVVTPYYNRPTARGLVLHFSAVAEATTTPIVLYNVPSRTGVDLQPETVAELGQQHEHIVAIKEALPSIERVKHLVRETPLGVLCGDDGSIADFVSLGAVGVIGVVNNLMPAAIADLVRDAGTSQGSVRAAGIVERIRPLVRDLFIESNPVPVKAALAMMMPSVSDEVRLPLAPLSDANRRQLRQTLSACGLL